MTRLRYLLPISLVAAIFTVMSYGVCLRAAPKPPKATSYPTVAQFSVDGIRSGITHDGRGPYYDGIDGLSSYRVAGDSTTNGWAFDLKAGRTTEPRQLVYDLTNPFDGPPQGIVPININDTHGQIYDLSNMTTGQIKPVRAAFHLIINRLEYVLRFGRTDVDGSSPLQVTRLPGDVFHVETNQGDLALYFRGNGPSEVLLGTYHVPIDLLLMNQ